MYFMLRHKFCILEFIGQSREQYDYRDKLIIVIIARAKNTGRKPYEYNMEQ